MGDRSIIAIIEDQKPTMKSPAVCFYAHDTPYGNGGKDTVWRALQRGEGRRNDSSYFSRVVFCQLMLDVGSPAKIWSALNGETGFGILPGLVQMGAADMSNPPVVINCATQKIGLAVLKSAKGGYTFGLPKYWMDFDMFIAAGPTGLEVFGEKGPSAIGSLRKKNPPSRPVDRRRRPR
jgi:hypothetical protein